MDSKQIALFILVFFMPFCGAKEENHSRGGVYMTAISKRLNEGMMLCFKQYGAHFCGTG